MTGRLSSMLLLGAAMMAMAAPVAAQETRAAGEPAKCPLDVAITYNATTSGLSGGRNFWMQGGGAQVHGRFYGGLGVAADVAGAHVANINSTGVGLDLVTTTFGPRYTWSPAHSRYALFGQGLVGVARGFNSVFPAGAGAASSQHSLAFELGGGMNVALSPHLALRAFEADWLRTQLPSGIL